MPEKYRGEINGVQNGLNSGMDTLKFALVIALPTIDKFGYLVIASVTALATAGVFFSSYAFNQWKSNTKIAPTDKLATTIQTTNDGESHTTCCTNEGQEAA